MTIFIILACAALAVAAFLYFFPLYKEKKEGLLALTYHNIGTAPENCMQKHLWVSPELFKQQLEQLKKNGFTFVTTHDIEKGSLPPKSALITFDNGYKNFYAEALPILKQYNVHALVFLVADYIGSCNFWHDADKKGPWQQILNAKEIEQLIKSGLVIFGSKTLTNADLTKLPEEERNNQIEESAHRLHGLYKIKPQFFAYPYSNGEQDEAIKNKVASVYQFRFADTGKINPLPLESGALINRVQVNGGWNKFVFYLKITGR